MVSVQAEEWQTIIENMGQVLEVIGLDFVLLHELEATKLTVNSAKLFEVELAQQQQADTQAATEQLVRAQREAKLQATHYECRAQEKLELQKSRTAAAAVAFDHWSNASEEFDRKEAKFLVARCGDAHDT